MITKEQVIPIILQACPSYAPRLRDYPDNGILYCALGDFADHLLDLHARNCISELREAAEVIEKLHIEGDSYVREAATIGLLEGIQNDWGNKGANPEDFRKYLGPISAQWWEQLNLFWQKRIKFVGETIPNNH